MEDRQRSIQEYSFLTGEFVFNVIYTFWLFKNLFFLSAHTIIKLKI